MAINIIPIPPPTKILTGEMIEIINNKIPMISNAIAIDFLLYNLTYIKLI